MVPPDNKAVEAAREGAPAGGSGEARAPESRVLGELLATPTFLLTMPSAGRLAEFVARAVAYVPGVAACRVCLHGASAQTAGFDGDACEACPGKAARGFEEAPSEPSIACAMTGRSDRHVIRHATPAGLFGFTICLLGDVEAFAPYAPFLDNWGNFLGLALENRHHRERLEEMVAVRTLALQRVNDELRWEIDERARDVAERKRAEEGLRQAQKMEAFGQLAGGVAHDFNNLLTVIQGNVTLARLAGPLEAEQATALDEIASASSRAANLTRQLLTFSRRQAVQMRDLDMNEIVGNMTKMLQRLIGEHITLVARHAPGSARIHADPGMMEQVLMNLAVNSRDAMSRGGELVIQTEVVTVGAASGTSLFSRPGEFVRVSVSDSGTGIAPEHLPRIFEPFFTTKDVGRGTGLGLATVFGIVEQHHGWIDVESAPGTGTTFHIYLPHVSSAGPSSARRAEGAAPGGRETILLVEDEDSLRALARRILSGKGYRVLEAPCGNDALEVWRHYRDAIDLLFTDMVMPGGMTGRELAKRLLAERPGLRVLYSTGYIDEMPGADPGLRESADFLEKPYEAPRLLRAVRSCLDRGARAR